MQSTVSCTGCGERIDQFLLLHETMPTCPQSSPSFNFCIRIFSVSYRSVENNLDTEVVLPDMIFGHWFQGEGLCATWARGDGALGPSWHRGGFKCFTSQEYNQITLEKGCWYHLLPAWEQFCSDWANFIQDYRWNWYSWWLIRENALPYQESQWQKNCSWFPFPVRSLVTVETTTRGVFSPS